MNCLPWSWCTCQVSCRACRRRMINPFQAKNDFRIYLAAPSYKEQDSKERARNEEHENELLEMGEEAAFDEADNWVPHGPVQGEIENVLLDKVRARAVWITSVVENDEVTTHMYDHVGLYQNPLSVCIQSFS